MQALQCIPLSNWVNAEQLSTRRAGWMAWLASYALMTEVCFAWRNRLFRPVRICPTGSVRHFPLGYFPSWGGHFPPVTLPSVLLPSVHSLGVRKIIRPANTEWGAAGVVICLKRGADLHIVQLMPLPPRHRLLQWNSEWFTFLVPAYPDCYGNRPLNRY